MASSSGSASAAPAPRRTVRREICRFVMNMVFLNPATLPGNHKDHEAHKQSVPSFVIFATFVVHELLPSVSLCRLHVRLCAFLLVHLERVALHDAEHDRGELVPAGLRAAHDR